MELCAHHGQCLARRDCMGRSSDDGVSKCRGYLRYLGTSCKSPRKAPVEASLLVLGCDWLHAFPSAWSVQQSGSSVAASGLQKSAPAYEPCQQPAPATCLVVKPILNHQALPPTPSKGEARRIAKPPATIDNHQKLPSKLVCTRFCRAFRAASRQITPDLASFCVFSISPASLFPSLAAAHPTPPQPQPHPQPRAHQAFRFPLVGRIASHRKANLHQEVALQQFLDLTLYDSFVNATRSFCASQPRLHRAILALPGRHCTTLTRPSASISTRPCYI